MFMPTSKLTLRGWSFSVMVVRIRSVAERLSVGFMIGPRNSTKLPLLMVNSLSGMTIMVYLSVPRLMV